MRRSRTQREASTNIVKAPLDILSIMIVAVAAATVILFVVPWLTVESDLSGIDIASLAPDRWPHMDGVSSGMLVILPLVTLSILYQYARRWRDEYRPRRRSTTVAMQLIGILVTAYWIRTYTVNTTDYLNLRDPEILQPGSPYLPEVEFTDDGTRREYSTGDILQEQFTVFMWLHLMLGISLLILPWLDQRPEDDPPEI